MVTVIVILYVATFAAEVAGLALLVMEARASKTLLGSWKTDGMDPAGTYWSQVDNIGPTITNLIGNPRRRWVAVALIGAGIVLGFVSNLLSLYV